MPSSASARTSPSPPQGSVDSGEEKLPGGYCRYLLPQHELRGQRCGCVHFTLNRSIPSATCICGHMSCFHTNEPYLPELDHLKSKIKALEAQVERVHEEKLSLVARVSTLEEIVEKSREEASLEIKGTYQNLNRAWHQIAELERQTKDSQFRFRNHDEQLQALQDETRRLADRQLELNDADISLEERVENLEEMEDSTFPDRLRPQRRSITGATPPPSGLPQNLDPESGHHPQTPAGSMVSAPLTINPPLRQTGSSPTAEPSEESNLWTVHISLLPMASLAMPFEKDTNAYKRCLSRGLHQMVVIDGLDAESVVSCVTRAFESLLRGRKWIPLQARLCNAESLQGLPMLRQLDESLLHGRYDAEFLRRHCAVCHPSGQMDSLYIAMPVETLSWHFLRRSPVFMPGLEACWNYDPRLDLLSPFDEDDAIDDGDRPSAGDFLPSTFTTLKRGASEISRSSSFGASSAPGGTTAAAAAPGVVPSTTDGEGSRPKIPRVLPRRRAVV